MSKRAGIEVPQVKPPLAKVALHIRISQCLAVLLPVQLPADVSGKAIEDGLSAWALEIYMGNLDGFPSSYLCPDLAPATKTVGE